MKTTIKPISQQKSESNQHGTNISVWVLNESTVTVWLGALIEDDYVLYLPIQLHPNERKQLNIYSEDILAIELEQLPPENKALYLTNDHAMDTSIRIADDTDEVRYPIRIGIASEILEQVTEDYEFNNVVILQDNKYPNEDK